MDRALPARDRNDSDQRLVQEPLRNGTATRLGWVDTARGIGIILVVQGHVWRGLDSSALISSPAVFKVIDGLVYAFHMPFLFLVSGLFFHRSVISSPVGKFIRSRLERLIWPLIIWTWIFFLFKIAAGSLANAPMNWAEFPFIPLPPREQFWFLWALFLMQIAILGFRPLLVRESLATTAWILIAGLALALYIVPIDLTEIGPWVVGALIHAPYFVLGAIIGRSKDMHVGPLLGALAFAVFIAVQVANQVSGVVFDVASLSALLIGIALSLSLLVAVKALDSNGSDHPLLSALRFLGQASLAIYVAHVIFAAGARTALKVAGIDNVWVHLAIGDAIGIVGPVVLYLFALRLGRTKLFGF